MIKVMFCLIPLIVQCQTQQREPVLYHEDSYILFKQDYYDQIKVVSNKYYYFKPDSSYQMRKMYDEEGKILSQTFTKNKLLEGPFRMFYNSGKLIVEGYYRNNQKDSIWTTYDTSGKIKKIEKYLMGVKAKSS